MDDIIFLVLIFLIFIYGISSSYENFESVMTPEDDMYQSNQVTVLTEGLDENITGTTTGITTMVGNLTGEVEGKINGAKSHIESCAGKVEYSVPKYTWDNNGCENCNTGSHPCNWGCTKKIRGVCVSHGYRDTCSNPCIKYGCFVRRSDEKIELPKWTCSDKPSGYKEPKKPADIYIR